MLDGQTLSSGGCLLSPNANYELTMQADGNLVLYFKSQADPLWDSRTDGDSGASAIMQTDGNLVVYAADGTTALWSTNTMRTPLARLVLQNDGNAVVYGSVVTQAGATGANAYPAWSSGTSNLRGYQLTAGQVLEPTQYLRSKNGEYGLTMGSGGAWVLYQAAQTTGQYQCPMFTEPAVTGANPLTYVYDTTRTTTTTTGVGIYPFHQTNPTEVPLTAGAYLDMQEDGNLVLYAPTTGAGSTALWGTGTQGHSTVRAVLQTDGNFVLYTQQNVALWASGTAAGGGDRGWALCSGDNLQAGQSLHAVPWYQTVRLTMQSTCNLVIYLNGRPQWSSATDVDTAKSFTKSSKNSTLWELPPTADYSGCYARLGPTGLFQIVAPSCSTCFPTTPGVNAPPGHVIWTVQATGPVLQMPTKSFGPFVVHIGTVFDKGTRNTMKTADNHTGFYASLNIDNGAGFLATQNPQPGNHHSGGGTDIGQDILGYFLMVAGAFL